MTLKPKAMDSVKPTQNAKPASEVFELQENLVEIFCFSRKYYVRLGVEQ